MNERPFLLSTLVDFPDDCQRIEFTEDLVAQLIDRLHWMGVRRVYWNYYNAGHWEWFLAYGPLGGVTKTLENLGDPMRVGRRLAHERGMEFYAVIKPYENGVSHAKPKTVLTSEGVTGLPGIGGSYHVDPWVLARPELRVTRPSGRSATGAGQDTGHAHPGAAEGHDAASHPTGKPGDLD